MVLEECLFKEANYWKDGTIGLLATEEEKEFE